MLWCFRVIVLVIGSCVLCCGCHVDWCCVIVSVSPLSGVAAAAGPQTAAQRPADQTCAEDHEVPAAAQGEKQGTAMLLITCTTHARTHAHNHHAHTHTRTQSPRTHAHTHTRMFSHGIVNIQESTTNRCICSGYFPAKEEIWLITSYDYYYRI